MRSVHSHSHIIVLRIVCPTRPIVFLAHHNECIVAARYVGRDEHSDCAVGVGWVEYSLEPSVIMMLIL